VGGLLSMAITRTIKKEQKLPRRKVDRGPQGQLRGEHIFDKTTENIDAHIYAPQKRHSL
jgi:hypothetical protein